MFSKNNTSSKPPLSQFTRQNNSQTSLHASDIKLGRKHGPAKHATEIPSASRMSNRSAERRNSSEGPVEKKVVSLDPKDV